MASRGLNLSVDSVGANPKRNSRCLRTASDVVKPLKEPDMEGHTAAHRATNLSQDTPTKAPQ